MKLKDLPPKQKLNGLKVRTHEGQEGYWAGYWGGGIWLCDSPNLKGKIVPVLMEDLTCAHEWEILDYTSINNDSNK